MTTGDRQHEWSLAERGGKGLFTSELEEALRSGEGDLAVHSAKDLPGEESPGLAVAGYLPREDARDVLVCRSGIGEPTTIATGSPRRRAQALLRWPGARFCEIRGNVDTRLRKIADQGLADASILAAAGLRRLGIRTWPGAEFHLLGLETMVPAVAQGAIALQCREADAGSYAPILDAETAASLRIERALQTALGAGCHTAFAAHAAGGTLHLFHERTGIRRFPLGGRDHADPAAAAVRILREAGLAA